MSVPNSGIEAPLLPNVELPNADDVADVPKVDPVAGPLKIEFSPKVGVTPRAEAFELSDFVASDFPISVSFDCDPNVVDIPIPANDDASKAIRKILTIIVDAIKKGLELRQNEKDAAAKSESKDSFDSSEIKSETSGPNENVESKNKDEEVKEK